MKMKKENKLSVLKVPSDPLAPSHPNVYGGHVGLTQAIPDCNEQKNVHLLYFISARVYKIVMRSDFWRVFF